MTDAKAVDRLGRLLGMLASDHDGERAAAALLASRHLRQMGLDWDGLLQRAFAPEPAPVPFPHGGDARCRETVARLLARWEVLNAWEAGFLHSLAARRRPLTLRQALKVQEIAERVERHGGER